MTRDSLYPSSRRSRLHTGLGCLLAAGSLVISSACADAKSQSAPAPAPPTVTYADLADLADSALIVARAQVRKIMRLDPDQTQGLRPGFGRFYIEARTRSLLWGTTSVGPKLRYLADFRVDARGKPPKLLKTEVILFARPIQGKPGSLQLVAPDGQVPATTQSESQVRAILAELAAPGSPPRITTVREAINVPGALAGESETQMFLSTREGTAAAIIVSRAPGAQPVWSYSFSELANNGTAPPARETLSWYRLACFLPGDLPQSADISERPQDRAQARADYRLVRRELGDCPRLRR